MENTDNSILLQFAKFSKGFRITDFDEFIEESIGVENLDFFGRLAYPNQWQIRLSNPELRESLIRKGKTRIKNRSCWMYPLNQHEIRGFVHWLPNSVTNDELMEQLKLYGNVLFIESQKQTIKGQKVESDPRYYGMMLTHGTIKEAIPHFLKINGYLCHLAVRGREPACFHCKEVGHVRAECPKYKAKLLSYCNREPNTAPKRSKPRGRRHVKDKTVSDEVSSSADIVRLEREVPVDEETTDPQPLPVSEVRERFTEVQEEATSSSEKELAETGVPTERTAKSGIGIPDASFSETERQGIIETLQQIQRRTAEDLRQRFQNFRTEIAQAITRGKLSTYTKHQMRGTVFEAPDTAINLEPEISQEELEKPTKEICAKTETFTPIERSGNDSNVDTNIKERKGDEMPPTLPPMHEVKGDIAEAHEKILKKFEELGKHAKEIRALTETFITIERPGKDSNVDTNTQERKGEEMPSTLPPMHEVKVDITETHEKIRKESEELEKETKEICAPTETFTPIERSGTDYNVDTNIKERKGDEIPPTLPPMHEVKVDITETHEKVCKKSEELEKQTKEICTQTETFFPIERSGEDSNVDIKERKGDEMPSTLPPMHEVKLDITETHEKARKKSEELENAAESTVSGTMSSVLLILEQTKQIATETIQRTFKKLEEFEKSYEATEILAKESATDTEQKLAKGEMRSELVILEQTKQTASDYFGSTFKKLEEEIATLSLQLTDEQSDTDTKLTKDDIQFAYQRLNQIKETVGGTLQNTFENLAVNLEKEIEPAEITTKSSIESKPPLKVAESSTKSSETLKHDIVKHFVKEVMKDVVEAENSEKQSAADKRQKETIESECDPGDISQVPFESAKISESSEKSKNEAKTEKALIVGKLLESHLSKSIQEKNDELQMSLCEDFSSFLARHGLRHETRVILEQLKLKVNETLEMMKNIQ